MSSDAASHGIEASRKMMVAPVWNRIMDGVSALTIRCPLLGTCHRIALAIGARRGLRSGSAVMGSSSPGAIESNASSGISPTKRRKAQPEESLMASVEFTASSFSREVEAATGVVLVDFWAPWCMPCRLIGPMIERLAVEFQGRATIGKLNVAEYPGVAARYQIRGIPTVGIFRGGQLINLLVGVRPERAYRAALETALDSADPAQVTAKKSMSSAAAKHSVTVFSTPTCPWCTRLKTYLREKQIAFKDVDVSRDAAAAQDMMRRSGQMGVPQAWIDGQVVVGFDRRRIDALLGLPSSAA
jgi:thioredoxin